MSKQYKIPVSYFVPVRIAVDGFVIITAKDEKDLLKQIKKIPQNKLEVIDDFEITDEMDNVYNMVRRNNSNQEIQSMSLNHDFTEDDIIQEIKNYEVN